MPVVIRYTLKPAHHFPPLLFFVMMFFFQRQLDRSFQDLLVERTKTSPKIVHIYSTIQHQHKQLVSSIDACPEIDLRT